MNLDVNSIVGDLAGTIGTQLVDTAVAVIPVVLPVLAVFWGIRYVQGKIGFGKASAK